MNLNDDIQKLLHGEAIRIIVIGTSASGKSTFAQALSGILEIDYIELDALNWGPNWTANPNEEFQRKLSESVSQSSWVVDGNYGLGKNPAWARATIVIWLNYTFATIFWRGLKRTIRRGVTRELLWSNNQESLRLAFFSRDSILLWIITTFRRRRRECRTLMQSNQYRNLVWIEFKVPAEARKFLDRLG